MGRSCDLQLFFGLRGSGKSGVAEARILSLAEGQRPLYIATLPQEVRYATVIARHRARRGGRWSVIEMSAHGEAGIRSVFASDLSGGVILDGMVTHIATRLSQCESELDDSRRRVAGECGDLVQRLRGAAPRLFVVTNIPDIAAARRIAPTQLDVQAMSINYSLCAAIAELGASLWLCSEGRAANVDWPEIARWFEEFDAAWHL